jgi:hypothetical protein
MITTRDDAFDLDLFKVSEEGLNWGTKWDGRRPRFFRSMNVIRFERYQSPDDQARVGRVLLGRTS